MLLCVYFFGLLKPIIPIANDFIAQTFYKWEHLATVHYENVKYPLHSELAATENQQKNKSKETTPASGYVTVANHLNNQQEKLMIYANQSSKIVQPQTQHPADTLIRNSTPPPMHNSEL